MMRSLYSAISGLRNHQTRMDVIGNNIANVNTTGFKQSRVTFQDTLSQTLQGASSAAGNQGGTNPMQVGLGMGLASIDTIFTDGSFSPTGKSTDLGIAGDGFFILSNGQSQMYTRNGAFDFDTLGNFVMPGSGYKVVGWKADASGNIDTTQPTANIQIPVGATMPAKASTKITYGGNLLADAAIRGTTAQAVIDATNAAAAAAKAADAAETASTTATATAKTAADAADAADAATATATAAAKTAADAAAKAKAAAEANPTDSALAAAAIAAADAAKKTADAATDAAAAAKVAAAADKAATAVAAKAADTKDAANTAKADADLAKIAAADYAAGASTVEATLAAANKVVNSTAALVTAAKALAAVTSDPTSAAVTATATLLNDSTATTVKSVKSTSDTSSQTTASIEVYDSQGNAYKVSGTFEKTAANTWSFTPASPVTNSSGAIIGTVTGGTSTITFNDNGTFNAVTTAPLVITPPVGSPYAGAGPTTVNLNFAAMTQYGGGGSTTATSNVTVDRDGYTAGTLESKTVSSTGVISGRFSNGQSQDLAQVALASFNNPGGLEKYGESLYVKSNNSGEPRVGTSGTGGRGKFSPGTLEMSNVDLATEFSNMIVTQRGFQANSKVITTTDTMLEELVNLKR